MSATNQKLEVKILIQEKDLIPADMKQERGVLAANAQSIKTVTTGDADAKAGEMVVEMRKHVKAVEADRMSRTRVLDDAKKLLKEFYDSHNEILIFEIERLKKLGDSFAESERRRVAEEERKRQEEFQEAQRKQFELDEAARIAAESGSKTQQMIANRKLEIAKQNVQAVIAAPAPEINRAKGKVTKQVLKWEVTDLMELVKHNPQLCKIEPKASAINATCHPNLPVPGLKLWFESESNYTTR